MAFGYLAVAILAAAVAVFALQNGTAVPVRFLVWTLTSTSIASLTLLALAVGVVVAGIPLWFRDLRMRSRVRGLELKVGQLETALEERNRALLAQPPSSRPP